MDVASEVAGVSVDAAAADALLAQQGVAAADRSAALQARLQVRLLGPLSISRDGAELELPGSRKARALLGYLALAPRPVASSSSSRPS